MKANVQIIFIVNLFFALFVFSNSIGSELGNDIKIEMTYLPGSKTINLSITNTCTVPPESRQFKRLIYFDTLLGFGSPVPSGVLSDCTCRSTLQSL